MMRQSDALEFITLPGRLFPVLLIVAMLAAMLFPQAVGTLVDPFLTFFVHELVPSDGGDFYYAVFSLLRIMPPPHCVIMSSSRN